MQGEKNKMEDSTERWKSQGRAAAAAAVDEGANVFDNLKETSGQVADKAKEFATNIKDKAQEYGEMAIDETGSFIRRYPAQSLLVGFGAGLAIGLLVARR